MKGLVVAALIALGSAASEDHWYVARLDQDVCVPLEKVGDDGELLTVGQGKMRTPEDFVQYMRELGGRMVQIDIPDLSWMRAYKEVGEDRLIVVFFHDRKMCHQFMDYLEPEY
jgi:hypothetical protein